MEIAQEILRQLGGPGRLKALIGAKNYVGLKNGLQFQFMKGNGGINCVRIWLNARDLYDVEFVKLQGFDILCEPEWVAKDVFVADLPERFREVAGLAIRF